VKERADFYKKKVSPALFNFLQSINTDNYEQSKKDLISALSEASGKPASEVEAQVASWQKSFEDAKAKAIQLSTDAAKKSAKVMSHFAFIYFFVILASLVAAGVGGMMGATCKRTSSCVNVQ
jgi:predicted PurR-regulated permease PerM